MNLVFSLQMQISAYSQKRIWLLPFILTIVLYTLLKEKKMNNIKEALKAKFQMSDLGPVSFY